MVQGRRLEGLVIIHIPLETPSKKNSRVVDRRTGRTFPNKRFTEWHKAAALYVSQQNAHPLDEGPFALYLEFTHGDRVRRDSDNGVSSILDLLVDCGILPDDNWMVVQKINVSNLYDKGNPGVNISIVPLTVRKT
jgi:Holliday junction resolvase RusA-like endonuclease